MLTASTPLGIAAGRFATFRIISRGQIRSFRRSASFLQWVRFPAAPPEGPYLSGPLCWDYHLRDDPKSTLGLVQCSTCSAAATWTRFLASGQGAVWLDRLATVRRSAVDQQTPSARRPAAWTCWTRQQLRRNSQVLSRNLPCLRVTLRRSSRISPGHVTGSIPGSSTEKMLVRATSSGQFSFSSAVADYLPAEFNPDRGSG